MSDSLKAVTGIVKGRVQGVGFRYFTQREAGSRGLAGWVLNRSDGDVEFQVEGPRSQVDELIERIKQGPRFSRVDDLLLEESTPAGHSDFQIRYE